MVAPPTHPLHLLRALLRECTYLPDSQARSYMHTYVLWSYRSYLPENPAWRSELSFKRKVRLLHRGRKYLSMLRRANEGYLKPLEKVLMMTYGRLGKRRRELMAELMAVEPPQNQEEVERFSLKKPYTKHWRPPPKVIALMRSQSKVRDCLDRLSAKIKVQAQLPKQNVWGMDLPANRSRNLTQEWYTTQVNLLFPPLPDEEREELHALAKGHCDWHGPIRRRSQRQSVKAAETGRTTDKILAEGPEKGHTFRGYVNGRPHHITARLMRRLWANVLRHVPIIFWDSEKSRWMVMWSDALQKRSPVTELPKCQDALLFGGHKVRAEIA